MQKHKWYNEIVAWASGAEIEFTDDGSTWYDINNPNWSNPTVGFRIKPQPKKPQYLYVYGDDLFIGDGDCFLEQGAFVSQIKLSEQLGYKYIGKIKLEKDT